MGSLTPPHSGSVHLDANCIIYSIEHIAPYEGLLLPIWQQATPGTYLLITRALSLLETLVGPIKSGDATLEADYHQLLQGASNLRAVAISDAILEQAARLRASINLKTPDAIYAATALLEGCTLFITNDPAFRRVPGLSVVVLRELVTP